MGIFSSKEVNTTKLTFLEQRQQVIDQLDKDSEQFKQTLLSLIPELQALQAKDKTNALTPGDKVRYTSLLQNVRMLDIARAMLQNTCTSVLVCTCFDRLNQLNENYGAELQRLKKQVLELLALSIQPLTTNPTQYVPQVVITPTTNLSDEKIKELYDSLDKLKVPDVTKPVEPEIKKDVIVEKN
jgi:hypothetical protein